MSKRIAVTGASSFTGLWIARLLQDRGWTVLAQCSRERAIYSGLRKLRVDLLAESIRDTGFGLDVVRMPQWIRETRPSIWVHHFHWMERFRAADYDAARAAKVGLEPLPAILEALAEVGCQGIVYTGTFFEPSEGAMSTGVPPTPYALSKRQVWERLQELAGDFGIPLSKVVVPNPIGPFENEDRLIPILIHRARSGEKMLLTTPQAVSDHLPVRRLAEAYADVAERLLRGEPRIARPSGWVGPVRDWVSIVNEELVRKRLGLNPGSVEVAPQADLSPRDFANPESERLPIDWPAEWDHYAAWLKDRFLG